MITACVALLLTQERFATHTSTESVTAMVACKQGVAIATRGGMLLFDGLKLTKQTIGDGPISNEVTGLQTSHFVHGIVPGGMFTVGQNGPGHTIAAWNPLLPKPQIEFVVGGDVTLRGRDISHGLPVKDFTSATEWGGRAFVGTAHHGVWVRTGSTWSRLKSPASEPLGHNIQTLAATDSHLYAGDLDRGLSRFDLKHRRWEPVKTSHPAIKELAVFKGKVYARLGSGRVDVLNDGGMSKFPADHTSAIGASDQSLLVGFRGGLVRLQTDGTRTVLRPDELKDATVTALCELGDGSIVVGTQAHGLLLGETDKNQQWRWRWLDQGLEMGDDWITKIVQLPDGSLLVGTFAAGASIWTSPGHFTKPRTDHSQVTDIDRFQSWVLLSTREHLYLGNGNRFQSIFHFVPSGEIQAMAVTPQAIWVGTRTGLYERRPSALTNPGLGWKPAAKATFESP